MKNSKIRVSGAHTEVSKDLHMKFGSCRWHRFLVTERTHRHTDSHTHYFIIGIDDPCQNNAKFNYALYETISSKFHVR